MESFISIDFETANQSRSSVCSVGIVVVEHGIIADSFYHLIRPNPNFYCRWATDIHGINYWDTINELSFPKVWENIAGRISDLPFVAHNSPFDESCLKAVHALYDMPYPDYQFYCTCRAARRVFPNLVNHQLHTVSSHIGFELKNHHNALTDAEACARIAINIL
ncbi:DNA polymerase III PolC-type [bioreactor metagenome]|uniref:DNA polymerase III PolC-type n=1 Tax=bioreactor metagenome TaxID=1076179 RepID=A0A645DSH2_9ZZZZ